MTACVHHATLIIDGNCLPFDELIALTPEFNLSNEFHNFKDSDDVLIVYFKKDAEFNEIYAAKNFNKYLARQECLKKTRDDFVVVLGFKKKLD